MPVGQGIWVQAENAEGQKYLFFLLPSGFSPFRHDPVHIRFASFESLIQFDVFVQQDSGEVEYKCTKINNPSLVEH